jgi:hypothetical protein
MKVKALQPLNLEGRNLNTGDEINLPQTEALVLIRAKMVVAVVERAVYVPDMEIRDAR